MAKQPQGLAPTKNDTISIRAIWDGQNASPKVLLIYDE